MAYGSVVACFAVAAPVTDVNIHPNSQGLGAKCTTILTTMCLKSCLLILLCDLFLKPGAYTSAGPLDGQLKLEWV